MAKRRPIVRDRRVAMYGGILAVVCGSVLIWDAFDARGIPRPWALSLLPGV